MCLNPILRPNPSYKIEGNSLSCRINAVARAFGKDADNRYIYVPCGHCADCVRARQNSIIQRADVESRYNHIFFATLTYDNKHLPKLSFDVPDRLAADETSSLFSQEPQKSGFDYDPEEWLSLDSFNIDDLQSDVPEGLITDFVVSSTNKVRKIRSRISSGFCSDSPSDPVKEVTFPFADIHDIQLLMKNLRDNLPEFDCFKGRSLKYIAVTELGKSFGRPHVHILFFVSKLPGDYLVTSLSGLKYVGSRLLRQGVIRDLERVLYQSVFKYWSHNVGTRKNPVYEPLFTYRKRFFGNKVNTNFDLHYVDPSLTTEGTANVSYYVTKYILKGSEFEDRRQKFLRLNICPTAYSIIWNTIKCKMLISKGFGVNGSCVTVVDEDLPKFNISRYAEVMESDDLPSDDCSFYEPVIRKRRIMIPDASVLSELHSNVCKDVGYSPFPVFVDNLGNHRSLGRYYYRFPQVLSVSDYFDIYYNYDDSLDVPRWLLSKVEKDDISSKFNRTLDIIDRNSSFDTSPALLYPGDSQDSNIFLNPLNDFHYVQS